MSNICINGHYYNPFFFILMVLNLLIQNRPFKYFPMCLSSLFDLYILFYFILFFLWKMT
jgi:hypothetical protein